MIRAVIDTNILVSALLSPRGNEAFLMIAIRNDRVTPCLTDEIVDEYIEVLNRSKFSYRVGEVADLIALFRKRGRFVQAKVSSASSPDPTDTKFIQCAVACSADFIVTGNRRHFPLSPYGSSNVVNSRELLAYLDSANPLRS